MEKRKNIIRKDILSECCHAPVEVQPTHDNNGEEIPAHNMFCKKCYRGVYSYVKSEKGLTP